MTTLSSNMLIPLMVIIPIICALLLNLFNGKDKFVKIIAIITVICLPLIPLFTNYGLHFFGGHVPLIDNGALLGTLPASIQSSIVAFYHPAITYSFSSLQKLFVFVLGLVAFSVVLTSLSESEKFDGAYGFLMFMGIAAVSALILSDDIFHMYVFFEIAALAQTGIVLASSIKNNYETALKYMMLSSLAAPFLLLGIALILGIVGSINITDIVLAINQTFIDPLGPVVLLALAFITFGWLYGSGLPPFHTIKSKVYSKAMPSGAALLQAFSVITFVAFALAILRIFGHIYITQYLIMGFSIVAMILGVTLALVQEDFKRVIGFLAVGELGYIGIGLALGTAMGVAGGLFQALNEMIITALLFIGFGTILYKTRISNINELGGLLAENPKISIVVLLAGFAMAGVPPLNGFRSKLMLMQSSVNAGYPELGVLMVVLSIVTFVIFVKLFYNIYLRPKPKNIPIVDLKIPKATIFAMVLLAIACIFIGLYPDIVVEPLVQFSIGMI